MDDEAPEAAAVLAVVRVAGASISTMGEQAKGVLAHTHGITTDEAFTRLRGYARSERRSIADVARALVERTIIF